jgi:radical SAM protein with 4Fe4S-binding SPASM domain
VQEANTKYPERFALSKEDWPICNTPWDVVGIRWNGDVVSCIYDYDNRYVIGNVGEESLWDIWNGDRMQAFRQAQVSHEFSCVEKSGKQLCSDCTIMWQKLYQAPTDFHSEVVRMKHYLNAAIDRVSLRYERTETMMKRHAYLKANRSVWLDELMAKIEPLRERMRCELGVVSTASGQRRTAS